MQVLSSFRVYCMAVFGFYDKNLYGGGCTKEEIMLFYDSIYMR